ncbi:MAG: hypothetical protein ABSH20_16690 [Tepidisphaeraceae bacterium]|jgi:phenylacetate-CoA ligase
MQVPEEQAAHNSNTDHPAVAAFQRAAATVPGYRQMLAERRVDPAGVSTLDAFLRITPVTDKQQLFGRFPLPELCADRKLDDIIAAYTSSGYTGTFSFGVETLADVQRATSHIDRMFVHFTGADRRRTLLINALPAGVRVPCSVAITMDIGPRADAAVGAVRSLGACVDQIAFSAEQPMLKLIAETGRLAGVEWNKHRIFAVTGAELMAENFRSYVGGIFGHDPERPEAGRIVLSVGISEVSLSLGLESNGLYRLRRAMHADVALRRALLGEDRFVPALVMYDPREFFLETPVLEGGLPRLVVTTLAEDRRIPLIRYATGDWARVIWPDELAGKLHAAGRDNLLSPDMAAPVLVLWGRGRGVHVGQRTVFPEQVKESLYSLPGLAGCLTGNFRMEPEAGRLKLRVQLKKGEPGPAGEAAELGRRIEAETGVPAGVSLVVYEEMPEGMELSYQKKFGYV